MTSGCTLEVQEFQNSLAKFKKMGFTIIGCSKDSVEKNFKFSKKYQLKYLLASDLTNVCEKLNIWVEKSMYGKKYFGIDRSTFMIDSKGKIFNKWSKVKVKGSCKRSFRFCEKSVPNSIFPKNFSLLITNNTTCIVIIIAPIIIFKLGSSPNAIGIQELYQILLLNI